MKVDNPNAFRFIMQDEVYLLEQDKGVKPVAETPSVAEAQPIPATPEPVLPAPQAIPEPVVGTPNITFNYLGSNNKNFLILVNYTTDEFIAAAHLTALENIIKRKELALDDVAILNLANHPQANLDLISDYFKPAKLLIMGQSSVPAGIAQPKLNELFKLNGHDALYSFSFAEMMESNDNKKAFWDQMKKL